MTEGDPHTDLDLTQGSPINNARQITPTYLVGAAAVGRAPPQPEPVSRGGPGNLYQVQPNLVSKFQKPGGSWWAPPRLAHPRTSACAMQLAI